MGSTLNYIHYHDHDYCAYEKNCKTALLTIINLSNQGKSLEQISGDPDLTVALNDKKKRFVKRKHANSETL